MESTQTSTKESRILRRRGTRHAPAEIRRAQILTAALACFAQSGYERATIDEVARDAGLSKGSVYRFFGSKDALLFALFDEFERLVFVELDGEDADRVLPKLERTGAMVADLLGGQRDLMQTWIEFFGHRGSRERMSGLYQRMRQRIARMVRAGVRSGELAKVAPADAAATVVGALEGLLLQAMVDPNFDAGRHYPGMWRLLERGLKGREV
jgi:AcrR family transcriptional regulator